MKNNQSEQNLVELETSCSMASSPVRVSTETITLPTYLPDTPDRNPMFLEKRV